ncbi:MAG: hypothetical protein M0Q87_14480, partial [Ottowia sp.]|nr:hypothetical protein [Ottowia sp.]
FDTQRAIRVRLTLRHVQVCIDGLNPLLGIRVRPWNIGVDVAWQGHRFDRLFDLDLHAVRTADGRHGCAGCIRFLATSAQGPAPLFPSLRALRAQHQYEAFLDWCNASLFPARHIQMVSTADGSTSADLVKPHESPEAGPQDFRCFHLPVWMDGSTTSNA